MSRIQNIVFPNASKLVGSNNHHNWKIGVKIFNIYIWDIVAPLGFVTPHISFVTIRKNYGYYISNIDQQGGW